MRELSDRVEEENLVVPDRILIEFEMRFRELSAYIGSEFFKKSDTNSSREKLDEAGIGELSNSELSILSHGSNKVNFRGSLYVLESSESGINSRGKPIRRLIYDKRISKPPKF